jgi:hypothetical protein
MSGAWKTDGARATLRRSELVVETEAVLAPHPERRRYGLRFRVTSGQESHHRSREPPVAESGFDSDESRARKSPPTGLPGLLYWYGVYPLNAAVFSGMLAGIARASRREGTGCDAPMDD